jgi:hypothetical protein
MVNARLFCSSCTLTSIPGVGVKWGGRLCHAVESFDASVSHRSHPRILKWQSPYVSPTPHEI